MMKTQKKVTLLEFPGRKSVNLENRKSVSLEEVKRDLDKIPGMAALIEEERANLQAAQLIREARETAHLTQAALAAKINVDQARISQMESGKGPYGPSIVLLARVAKACGGFLHLSFEKHG